MKMKHAVLTLGILVISQGCATPGWENQPSRGTSLNRASQPVDDREDRDAITMMPLYMQSRMVEPLEAPAMQAARFTSGKEKLAPQMPAPSPASENIAALRKAGAKLRLEASPLAAGPMMGGAGSTLLELRDDLSERRAILMRKSNEGTLSKTEKAEMAALNKLAYKLTDLDMQVRLTSTAAFNSANAVGSVTHMQMVRTAMLLRHRRARGQELTGADYAYVARGLEVQRRAELLASVTIAMLAGYQAVIKEGGDPKGLDSIAENAVAAASERTVVTEAEAREYVATLPRAVAHYRKVYLPKLKQIWEGMSAGAPGFVADMQSGTDATLAWVETANDQPQTTKARSAQPEVAAPRAGGGSAAAQGPLSTLVPGADAALEGIAALRRGDPKGALSSAMDLAPVPGLKQAFSLASALFFKN